MRYNYWIGQRVVCYSALSKPKSGTVIQIRKRQVFDSELKIWKEHIPFLVVKLDTGHISCFSPYQYSPHFVTEYCIPEEAVHLVNQTETTADEEE